MLALFLRATFIVKVVMLILVVASVWSWAIIIQKFINYRIARRDSDLFDRAFWSGEPLDELYEQLGPNPRGGSEKIFSAGMVEWKRSHRADGALIPGGQARIDRKMDVAINKEAESLNNGLTFLATVGAIAPFVGLFGTVWGIKNAFEQIAIQQNTNLAVVAPGIAEALIATGVGLFAAIPATIAYNYFVGELRGLNAAIDLFTTEFEGDLARVGSAGPASARAASA